MDKWNILFVDINKCASEPCLHNGTCINGIDTYQCQCAAGYNGSHCQNGKSQLKYDIWSFCTF